VYAPFGETAQAPPMLEDSPFAVLSFIAGPALLTNATTVLLLGTVNRYARALDRARHLAGGIATITEADEERVEWLEREIDIAHRRVLLIVRTLTAFYTAVGAFGLGTLAFLTGAILLEEIGPVASRFVTIFTLGTTVVGVICLIFGSGALVWESRLTYQLLADEAAQIRVEADRMMSKRRG